MLVAGGLGLMAARAFVPARRPPARVSASVPPGTTPGRSVATTAGTLPPVPRVRASTTESMATPSPERPASTAPEATPPVSVDRASPQAVTVHPEVRVPPEERRPAGPPPDDNALAQLRRAEQRRDALAQRVDRLRRRLDAGVVSDVDEYERVQAQLDDSLDELDQVENDISRLRRALVGHEP
jgi:hypothetical protein